MNTPKKPNIAASHGVARTSRCVSTRTTHPSAECCLDSFQKVATSGSVMSSHMLAAFDGHFAGEMRDQVDEGVRTTFERSNIMRA